MDKKKLYDLMPELELDGVPKEKPKEAKPQKIKKPKEMGMTGLTKVEEIILSIVRENGVVSYESLRIPNWKKLYNFNSYEIDAGLSSLMSQGILVLYGGKVRETVIFKSLSKEEIDILRLGGFEPIDDIGPVDDIDPILSDDNIIAELENFFQKDLEKDEDYYRALEELQMKILMPQPILNKRALKTKKLKEKSK